MWTNTENQCVIWRYHAAVSDDATKPTLVSGRKAKSLKRSHLKVKKQPA